MNKKALNEPCICLVCSVVDIFHEFQRMQMVKLWFHLRELIKLPWQVNQLHHLLEKCKIGMLLKLVFISFYKSQQTFLICFRYD